MASAQTKHCELHSSQGIVFIMGIKIIITHVMEVDFVSTTTTN